jgi:hypothetical protein
VENLLDLRDQAVEQIECGWSLSDSSDIGQSRSPCNVRQVSLGRGN